MIKLLGEKLKYQRSISKLTLSSASRKINLNKSSLSQLENGKKNNPSLKTLYKISSFYNIHASYFIDDEIPVILLKKDESVVEGKKLKFYREKRGFTVKALSLRSDVSERWISRIEKKGSDKTRAFTIIKLASALNISVDSLMQDNIDEQT